MYDIYSGDETSCSRILQTDHIFTNPVVLELYVVHVFSTHDDFATSTKVILIIVRPTVRCVLRLN